MPLVSDFVMTDRILDNDATSLSLSLLKASENAATAVETKEAAKESSTFQETTEIFIQSPLHQ